MTVAEKMIAEAGKLPEDAIDAAAQALAALRRQRPLVHNITNYVVMDFSANALLAIGASPVMAHAAEEVGEMVGLPGPWSSTSVPCRGPGSMPCLPPGTRHGRGVCPSSWTP